MTGGVGSSGGSVTSPGGAGLGVGVSNDGVSEFQFVWTVDGVGVERGSDEWKDSDVWDAGLARHDITGESGVMG